MKLSPTESDVVPTFRSAIKESYARGGARGERMSTTGEVGSATAWIDGAGAGVGDQKSASIGVCASITANIGAAAIAVKAKIAMQTTTTTFARGLISGVFSRPF